MSLTDPKRRFSATVDEYDKFRPSYPGALIDWILKTTNTAKGGRVADIGCGTGISTRQLAARGLSVVGVEPNEDMLTRAKAKGGEYVEGESSATGLPERSFDLVTAAQAFHWFELEPAFTEFARILKPGGWCAAFWNDRVHDTPFLRGYEELLLKYSSEYKELGRKGESIKDIKASPWVKDLVEAEFRNGQTMDKQAFLGRVYSSSYVAHGIAEPEKFSGELERLFEAHQMRGQVEFVYRTIGLCWRLQ